MYDRHILYDSRTCESKNVFFIVLDFCPKMLLCDLISLTPLQMTLLVEGILILYID
jgi:hypothetical protein